MRVAIIDSETSGVDPAVDHVLEVAVIVYDTKFAAPVEAYSSLVWAQSNAAEHVNGIPVGLVQQAKNADTVYAAVRNMVRGTNCFVAHNASFDKSFLPFKDSTWVCTIEDFEWPHRGKSNSLVSIALSHGVGVVHAHRAMSDVDTICRLFMRLSEQGHDVDQLMHRAMRPKTKFVAMVAYAEKDKAKEAGFVWDKDSKIWHKSFPEEDLKTKNFPFRVRRA